MADAKTPIYGFETSVEYHSTLFCGATIHIRRDMQITKEECLTLIADLWADKYPLVRRYFGKYLSLLVRALLGDNFYEVHFVKAAFDPQALERRLQGIESIGQTSSIVSEVGEIQDPIELDRRLMDAWAELRTISQISKEGFTGISKVTEIADLLATRGDEKVAFSVKRINNSLENQVQRRNKPDERDSSPYGEIGDIHNRLGGPLSYFFWEALNEKNGKFRKWERADYKRCIVLVSSDQDLQDSMVRHIACKKIREGIHLLGNRYFEELLWLPDNGNGAWFTVGTEPNKTRCFADWSDSPDIPFAEREERISRTEVNLDNEFPA